MKDRHEIDRLLRRLARDGGGSFADSEAVAAGISERTLARRVSEGELVRAGRGVLRHGDEPDGKLLRLAEVCIGLEAAASHRTAGDLLGILRSQQTEIEVSTLKRIRSVPWGVILHRPRLLPDIDLSHVHGIPVTTPARTLLDLGAVEGVEVVRRAVITALQKRVVMLEQLHEQLDRCGRKGRNGTAALRRVLAGLEPVEYRTDSLLEDKLIELLRRHRFPKPIRQWRVHVNGITVARPDLAWPRRNVVVEAYGYEFHSSRFDFVRDLRRHNLLTSLGLRVLYFTWDDLEEPEPFLDRLRAALEN